MYSVTELAELIRHHLVFPEADDKAVQNLHQLVAEIHKIAPRSLHTEAQWLFCDRCGCSVDTDVLAWDGSNFTQDGGFYCSSCLSDDVDHE